MDNKIRALALLEHELDGIDEEKEEYFERLEWVDKGGNSENDGEPRGQGATIDDQVRSKQEGKRCLHIYAAHI